MQALLQQFFDFAIMARAAAPCCETRVEPSADRLGAWLVPP